MIYSQKEQRVGSSSRLCVCGANSSRNTFPGWEWGRKSICYGKKNAASLQDIAHSIGAGATRNPPPHILPPLCLDISAQQTWCALPARGEHGAALRDMRSSCLWDDAFFQEASCITPTASSSFCQPRRNVQGHLEAEPVFVVSINTEQTGPVWGKLSSSSSKGINPF